MTRLWPSLKNMHWCEDVEPNEKGYLYEIMVQPCLHGLVRHDDLTEKQVATDKRLREDKRTMPRHLWMQLTKRYPEPTKHAAAEESPQTYDSLAEHTTWGRNKPRK
jgi:hypothetical protein